MRRVVLGIDQASSSGWGIAAERGPVVRHGLAKTTADRLFVVTLALMYAGQDPAWLWVVFEKHDHMPAGRLGRDDHTTARKGPRQHAPERSNQTLIGMGKSYGRWLEQLALVGVKESHIMEVRPSTWRSRVHGVTRGDNIKQAACDYATRVAGEPITNHDHAEGFCIATWAAIDGLAAYDAEKQRARIDARIKREQAKQADLFGGEVK